MKKLIIEEHVEENVLDILKSLDYTITRGSNEEYLHGGSSALRADYNLFIKALTVLTIWNIIL
ncbi:MAG: hypothetical protein Q8Q42_04645 [Nanoarchaeota archaeon]|nr:hypothetical protein [Nanoarchaeota archaeon]